MKPISNQAELTSVDLIHWKGEHDELLVSPRDGGRIVSWKHGKAGELVKPLGGTEGGLLRVMIGEERFPGTSYVAPHLARVLRHDPAAFSIQLRHFWNTSNVVARLLGWHDKANPTHFDGLVLDKTITYESATATLLVEFAFTNLTGEVRHITPWLQSHFTGWVHEGFVVMEGQRQRFVCGDVYWDGHRAEPGKSMRLVHTNRDGSVSVLMGASTDWLGGMASLTRAEFGEQSTDGCMELRGKTIRLPANQCWQCNAFFALGEGREAWQRWASEAPVRLFSRMAAAPETDAEAASLLPALQSWALPEEQRRGLMVLSHLDKVPFADPTRYSAANSFSSFRCHATGNRAQASVILFALRSFDAVAVELTGSPDWRVNQRALALNQHEVFPLILEGPANLAGKENVELRLSVGGEVLGLLRVEPDATLQPQYRYQVKQPSAYLDERWRKETSGFQGSTAEEFRRWRAEARRRYLDWINESVIGPVPLEPRVVERQVGPHCSREKILIQTEPGLWVPTYLVRPRQAPPNARLPAILFLHGSCPGKICFAPDETPDMYQTADEWPSVYQMAHQLGCLVLLPDQRGWGEWSEGNHGQQWQRASCAGYHLTAMTVWDQMRAVDYLLQRPDVDAGRIISMGSSGGGWMTQLLLGADERLAGGIVSSWAPTTAMLTDQYFFRRPANENTLLHPLLPWATASILSWAAPRALWIMDGKWDQGRGPALPKTEEERAVFAGWHAEADAGRAAVARAYRLLGAEGNYQASWFEGGHLAGFTFTNINGWLRQYFGIGASRGAS